MSNYVMEMSTNTDIIETNLNKGWDPIMRRYDWAEVCSGLSIAKGSTIVVIAHGNSTEIGNAESGTIDIDAALFLFLIQGNMESNGTPTAVYISTCGKGIAEFAANVRLLAEKNKIWKGTRIFGHCDPVSGEVPPPHDICWTEIF